MSPKTRRDTAVTTEDRKPLPRRIIAAVVRVPLLVLVTIYFLIDDVVLAALRPLVARLAELRLFTRLADWLHGLSPYPTLILFLIPFVILEPFKIGALVLLAQGKMVTGGVMLATAHLLSIVLVERLFHATRDKLLTIGWFAAVYTRVMRLYDWSLGRLKATSAWQTVAAVLRRLRGGVRTGLVLGRRRLAPVVAFARSVFAGLKARLVTARR